MGSQAMSCFEVSGWSPRFSAEGACGARFDPPCDLGSFVAERHNVPLSEAEGLIRRWVAEYEHRAPTAMTEISASRGLAAQLA
jgi:hypothetical protein